MFSDEFFDARRKSLMQVFPSIGESEKPTRQMWKIKKKRSDGFFDGSFKVVWPKIYFTLPCEKSKHESPKALPTSIAFGETIKMFDYFFG